MSEPAHQLEPEPQGVVLTLRPHKEPTDPRVVELEGKIQTLSGKLCECGCGGETRIATTTRNGVKRGEPRRFIKGHHALSGPDRPLPHEVEDRGYETPCWVFSGSRCEDGYGKAWRPRISRSSLAHRISWEWRNGPVPNGFELDHLCSQRDCINPDHLEATTLLTPELAARIRRECEEVMADNPCYLDGRPRTRLPDGEAERIAKKYGVARGSVSAIRCRRVWKDAA